MSNLFNADLWNTITEIGTVVMLEDVSSCSFYIIAVTHEFMLYHSRGRTTRTIEGWAVIVAGHTVRCVQ